MHNFYFEDFIIKKKWILIVHNPNCCDTNIYTFKTKNIFNFRKVILKGEKSVAEATFHIVANTNSERQNLSTCRNLNP